MSDYFGKDVFKLGFGLMRRAAPISTPLMFMTAALPSRPRVRRW